jgi:hypothetical protein
MTLAPLGIVATASSAETAFMVGSSQSASREMDLSLDVGGRPIRSFDLHQGYESRTALRPGLIQINQGRTANG